VRDVVWAKTVGSHTIHVFPPLARLRGRAPAKVVVWANSVFQESGSALLPWSFREKLD
jgi:hypothetical protein